MEKLTKPRKALNPKLRVIALITIIITAVLTFYVFTQLVPVKGAWGGALAGGSAALITLIIVWIIARIKGVDMYVER